MRSLFSALIATALMAGTAMADSTLITNARIVDGTGAEAFMGDVLVRDGTIADIFAPGEGNHASTAVIDAGGRVLAPGFIDLHTHGDPLGTSFANFLAMGVTTVTLGMDGSSDGLDADWKARAANEGLELNVIPMTGHGTVRAMAGIGDGVRALTREQTEALKAAMARELETGSFGLSMGLEYVPGVYSEAAELKALGEVVTTHDAVIMSHMRSEDDTDVEDAIDELVAMAPTGRVHISHLKVVYGKGEDRADDLLAFMEGKRASGTKLSADIYPYAASFTGIGILFPEWALPPTDYDAVRTNRGEELIAHLTARISKRGGPEALLFGTSPFAGQTLAEAAQAEGKDPAQLIADLGPRGGSAAHFVMDRKLVDRLVTAPEVALSTDGSPTMRHPRGYGTYARLIEYYVEGGHGLSLEAAIHKASGLPAEIMQLTDRGIIKPGMKADLILFDPAQVRERTSFVSPHEKASGFDLVMVGGVIAYANNRATAERPGTLLKPQ